MAKKKPAAKKKAAPQKKAVKKVAKTAAPKKAAKKAAPKKVAKKVAAKKVVKKVAPKKVVKKVAAKKVVKREATRKKAPRGKKRPFTTPYVTIPDTDLAVTRVMIIKRNGSTPAMLALWNTGNFTPGNPSSITGQVVNIDFNDPVSVGRDNGNPDSSTTFTSNYTPTRYGSTATAPEPAEVDALTLSGNNNTVYLTTVSGWLCWNTTGAGGSTGNQICPVTNIVYISQNPGNPNIFIGYVYPDKTDIEIIK